MHRADSDYSLLDPASGASSFFAQSDEEGDIVRVRVKVSRSLRACDVLWTHDTHATSP